MSLKIVLNSLKDKREKIGLTQEELAEMIGVTARTVQRIESGSATSMSTAKSIASVLELPSYEVLLENELDEQVNNEIAFIDKQQKQKLVVVKILQNATLIITALLWFAMILPIDKSAIIHVITIYAILPLLTIASVPSFKNKDKNLIPLKLSFGVFFGFSFFITFLSTPIFATLSYLLHPEILDSSMAGTVYLTVPGVENFISIQEKYSHLIWVVSGLLSLGAMLTIHVLIIKARNKKYELGYCLEVFFFTSILSVISSWLLGSSYTSIINISNSTLTILVTLIILLGIYFIMGKTTIQKNRSQIVIRNAALMIVIPSLSAAMILSLGLSYYKERVELSVYESERIFYCENAKNEDPICWDVKLLEENELPITEAYTNILNSRNGSLKHLYSLYRDLDIPPEYAIDKKPLPYYVLRLITDSYYKAVLFNKKRGTLENIIYGINGKGIYDLPSDVFVNWVYLAVNDLDKFILDYPNARKRIKNNPQLRNIYRAATGEWKVYDGSDNSKYYSLGGVGVSLPLEVRYDNNGSRISFEMIKKSYEINECELPVVNTLNLKASSEGCL